MEASVGKDTVFSQLEADSSNADRAGVETTGAERAVEPLVSGRPDMTALILADGALSHAWLSDGIARLRRRSVTVRHPLDAIMSLQDDSLAIGVILAPAHDPRFRALEFFAFVRDTFPRVRRLAFGRHDSEHSAAALVDGLVDGVLTYPAPLPVLAEALQSTPGVCRQPLPAECDERSLRQLFEAWKRSDLSAFEELDRRYRLPIHRLATALRFSEEDADEIVQETLLALFLGRRTFRGDSTPAQFICSLVATSVLARRRGDQRRTRLLLTLPHAAVVARTEREWSEQSDHGLVSLELAALVDAAIDNLA